MYLVRKIVWYILALQPLGWINSSDQAIGVKIYEIYVFVLFTLLVCTNFGRCKTQQDKLNKERAQL